MSNAAGAVNDHPQAPFIVRGGYTFRVMLKSKAKVKLKVWKLNTYTFTFSDVIIKKIQTLFESLEKLTTSAKKLNWPHR